MEKNGKQRCWCSHPRIPGVGSFPLWLESGVGAELDQAGLKDSPALTLKVAPPAVVAVRKDLVPVVPEEKELETHPVVPFLFQRSRHGGSGGVCNTLCFKLLLDSLWSPIRPLL